MQICYLCLYGKTKPLFDRIKDLSFWQRLFQWRRVRNLSFDAYEEFRALARETEAVRETAGRLQNRITELSAHNKNLSRRVRDGRCSRHARMQISGAPAGAFAKTQPAYRNSQKKVAGFKPHVKTTLKTITRTSHG